MCLPLLPINAEKVKKQFLGSLSGNIKINFFNGARPVSTGMKICTMVKQTTTVLSCQ